MRETDQQVEGAEGRAVLYLWHHPAHQQRRADDELTGLRRVDAIVDIVLVRLDDESHEVVDSQHLHLEYTKQRVKRVKQQKQGG